ncbi:diguanylate cyclase (GGDEF) domain-containing protein [Treponema sp. JC4]|uniref:GGDEF domain-containing protein n=1 Tax=Treponema sp. JC4 TaxID=1124982 RepID=UPI00025B0AD3|nr:GGDEF domain-containing protein [Treponema sp. JC4]EID84436.1 diguanylate cyclase (GGDEF) domain-containing protein [Treponema sp. JC4]
MEKVDWLYFQVNLVCLMIMAKLWRTVFYDYKSQYESRLFSYVLLSTTIFTISDAGWIIFTSLLFPGNIFVNYLVNIVYFVSSAFIGITWFWFCEFILGFNFKKNKALLIILHIPFLALFLMSLSSPLTHYIFYIDDANVYQRGPYHMLQVFCMNVYFIITSIQGIIRLFDKNEIAMKKKYISISTLILWAFTAQMIQVCIPGYPTIEIGLVMALFSVYVELRNSIISIDQLTQINNRTQLLKYLSQKFKSFNGNDSSKNLYLMVLDVDDFKHINDKFGHMEGDFALKLVADSLKKVAANTSCFISRLGGDEFVVVTEKENDKLAENLSETIRNQILKDSSNTEKQYKISTSIGFAKKDTHNATVADLLKSADEAMYHNKQKHKKQAD